MQPKQHISLIQITCSIALIFAHVIPLSAQVHLVLRDMTKIETRSIEITPEWIATENGRRLGWEEVLFANGLTASQQSEFNTFLNEIGWPLFKIRHRLSNRDWRSLPEISEPLAEKIAGKFAGSNQQTAYLVRLACCRGKLALHHRVDSLRWFIKLCELNRLSSVEIGLDKNCDFTKQERKDFFTEQILPIWFDGPAAKELIGELQLNLKQLNSLPDGLLIYAGSLYSSIGDFDSAKLVLNEMSNRENELVKSWLPIIRAMSGQDSKISRAGRLVNSYQQLKGPLRAVANYVVASRRRETTDDNDVAVLDLLFIPANFSRRYPSLSAAALSLAADISEETGKFEEAEIIREDLRSNYKDTFHENESRSVKRNF